MWNYFYIKVYCLRRLCGLKNIQVIDDISLKIFLNREFHEINLKDVKKKYIDNNFYVNGNIPKDCPGIENPNPDCLDIKCSYCGYIYEKLEKSEEQRIDDMLDKKE